MSIRTAIVGCGFSAKTFHIPFITTLPEFEFCAVSSSQAEMLKQDWPGINVYASATEMIEGSDADLVMLTLAKLVGRRERVYLRDQTNNDRKKT